MLSEQLIKQKSGKTTNRIILIILNGIAWVYTRLEYPKKVYNIEIQYFLGIKISRQNIHP